MHINNLITNLLLRGRTFHQIWLKSVFVFFRYRIDDGDGKQSLLDGNHELKMMIAIVINAFVVPDTDVHAILYVISEKEASRWLWRTDTKGSFV